LESTYNLVMNFRYYVISHKSDKIK